MAAGWWAQICWDQHGRETQSRSWVTTESQDGSGWKGAQPGSSLLQHSTGHGIVPRWFRNIPREGNATASLGNQCQCLVTGKSSSMLRWNSLGISPCLFLLCSCLALPRGAWSVLSPSCRYLPAPPFSGVGALPCSGLRASPRAAAIHAMNGTATIPTPGSEFSLPGHLLSRGKPPWRLNYN